MFEEFYLCPISQAFGIILRPNFEMDIVFDNLLVGNFYQHSPIFSFWHCTGSLPKGNGQTFQCIFLQDRPDGVTSDDDVDNVDVNPGESNLTFSQRSLSH